jgi:sarcosine oxidase, subunit gamma
VTDEHLAAVDQAQVGLRADPSTLPFEPPGPNNTTTWDGREVLWLGPDEWLVVGQPGTEGSIQRELEGAMQGHHYSVIDVSANRIVFDLSDGLDLLSSGCSLDLHPSRWRPGMCAQTLFGQAQVILHQLDDRTTRVFVRLSFADYFVDRLAAAPTEPRRRSS